MHSRFLYIVPVCGVGISILLTLYAYTYPEDLSTSPEEYAIKNGIILGNFFGCFLAVFVANKSLKETKSIGELELTKPVTRGKYFLFQTVGETIFPLAVVSSILLGTQLYLLFRGERFSYEIFVAIALLGTAVIATTGLIKVLSLLVDTLPALGLGIATVIFSLQAFRGTLARVTFPLDGILYLLPDLQTPQHIALNIFYRAPIEWKYLVGPITYIFASLILATVILGHKDL
jgi:hypothetical protein